jgi:tetratricopeptide (TPR) repeat protein/transcriptional regulator with XRE-family HTH domain
MTVDRWTGREARLLRQALRLSVRGFAEYLGVAARTVSRWEQHGLDRVPRPEFQAALDTALRMASDEGQQRFHLTVVAAVAAEPAPSLVSTNTDATSPTAPPAVPSPVHHQIDPPEPEHVEPIPAGLEESPADAVQFERLREAVHDTLAGGTMTGAGLDDWEQAVLLHGRATRYRAAGPLLLDLAADCRELHRLLSLPQSASTAHRLTRVMAQMAGLMSLTLIKLDHGAASSNWGRTARLAADEAGDKTVRSWVRAQEAYTAYYGGDLPRAVEVARHAQALARETNCVGVALAAALEARAQARLGQATETHRALAVADIALDRLDADSVTESAFGYNEAQLRFHEGNALTHLGDTDAARSAHERALELYPNDNYLDRALVHLDQAACLVQDGEPDAALAQAATTLLDLTIAQREGIIDSRARQVLGSLSRDQGRLPAARELRDIINLPADEKKAAPS